MYHKPHVNDHGLILLRVVGDSVFRVHSLLHFHLWTFLYQLYTKGPRYLILVEFFFLAVSQHGGQRAEGMACHLVMPSPAYFRVDATVNRLFSLQRLRD